ncbi:MAG: hypothetical protein ACRDRL_04185, partial [Sciscionella sp.]
GISIAAARTDAVLGLAADAIGMGRDERTSRLLDAAQAGVDQRSWRSVIRLHWVRAEAALAAGDPAAARHAAMAAVSRAEHCPSLRHRVKSSLVLAAALATLGGSVHRQESKGLLHTITSTSLDQGYVTLFWPSALLLAELDLAAAARWRDRARSSLSWIYARTDARSVRAARCSPWMPNWLLHSGDDVTPSEFMPSRSIKHRIVSRLPLQWPIGEKERHSAVGRSPCDDGVDL